MNKMNLRTFLRWLLVLVTYGICVALLTWVFVESFFTVGIWILGLILFLLVIF